MTLTFTIDAVPGGFQGSVRRDGSAQAWRTTEVLPTEDAVAEAVAKGIYRALLMWGSGQWGTKEWA